MAHPSIAMAKEARVSFVDCLTSAFANSELRSQFERLTGHSFAGVLPTSGLEALIDKAAGHNPAESTVVQRYMQAFAAFVRECVWTRLPLDMRVEDGWVPTYPLRSGAGDLLPC